MRQNSFFSNKLRFIGITGGIGAGKSEILRYIKEHYNCEIYLADEVAHQVKEPGQPCFDKLVALLGREILAEDGTIERSAMAAKIFSDEGLLQKVNEIVHPAVMDYITEKYEQANDLGEVDYFFVEAALLIEAGYKQIVDELWYIHAKQEVREERLRVSRGYSDQRIADIMSKQLSEEEFFKECDFVIDNSGNLEEACRQIDDLLNYL